MKTISTWIILALCSLITACSTTKSVPASDFHLKSTGIYALEAPAITVPDSPAVIADDGHNVPSLTRSEIDDILAHFKEESEPELSEILVPPEPNARDLHCLTQVMYFEARGEGNTGMLGVAHVVMNRVSDKRFPNTVCAVVKQGRHVDGKPVLNRCQFSWYCDGLPEVVKDKNTYKVAEELARSVLMGLSINPVGNSVYFHATNVKPKWSRVFAMIRKIGHHIFYYA